MIFFYYYKTLNVETKTQILLYDVSRMLSTFGGSLGLFLGVSCYGFFVWLLENIKEKIILR